MTFEYRITRESEHYGAIVGSIDLTIDFNVTDWECPARIRNRIRVMKVTEGKKCSFQ